MPKKIIIDKNDINSCIKQGMNSKEICDKLKISRSVLFKNMKNFSLSFKDYKYFNINIFDNIDTEEKAYWLGFLYADGYVCGYHNQLEISLKGDDIEHLRKFKSFLEDKRDESVIKTSDIKLNGKTFKRCRYIIGDEHFHSELIKLGCIPNKSLKLTFPEKSIFSDDKLIVDFIRGYIDGDGCLTNSGKRLRISISGTEKFLNEIIKIFPEFSKPKKDKRGNVYQIICSHNKADKIAKNLYENATIYLDRKYKQFASLVK